MSDGRVGIDDRRFPNRGDADGETEGVTLLTGVNEFGVGEEEAEEEVAATEREFAAEEPFPLLLLLLARKLSFLLGVVGVTEEVPER